jgi:hypothetical protein
MLLRRLGGLAFPLTAIVGCGVAEPELFTAESLQEWCDAFDVWDNSGRLDIADYDHVIELAPRDLTADLQLLKPLMQAFLEADRDDPSSQLRVKEIVSQPGIEDAFERVNVATKERCDAWDQAAGPRRAPLGHDSDATIAS